MGKIQSPTNLIKQGITMSNPTPHTHATQTDQIEDVVKYMPLVLPMAGGVMIFLMAFIAVFMG